MREKYELIKELRKKNEDLVGDKKLALVGQGDFPGANNPTRSQMNMKHRVQALTIDDPEFPFLFDGKENVMGAQSSFYRKTDRQYKVVGIVKKYNDLLKGRSNIALYFLYSKENDSYRVIERNEVENLTEDFGFKYRNDYLDNIELGDVVDKDTILYRSTSYDESMNMSAGVNGRILYAMHPGVQDDAIIISESFANRMVSNQVTSKSIPINDNTILLNLYGKDDVYQGLPNIGETVVGGILAATRNVKETRMFSDLRDNSLNIINHNSDQVFYANGEIIDINVYCNNPNLKVNKVNKQLVQYYNDARWFYTEVYKICKRIINSGATIVDKEINRWMRKSMNNLDTQAIWAWNDNVFSNMMVEILVNRKQPIRDGRKLAGRHGNKSVVSKILPDEEMPYLVSETYKDEYGVIHPKGEMKRVELISNPLAIINRTIPMGLFEPSVTFILDRMREYMKTLPTMEEQRDFMFDALGLLNHKYTKELKDVYDGLSPRQQKEFVHDSIHKGIYLRWEAFSEEVNLRDNIVKLYDKYESIIKPYHIFSPKPKWGRDIYIGTGCVGFQYVLMLKQSGEKGFSARSAGAINDESLPEKSHDSKISKAHSSDTPIRFGEDIHMIAVVICQTEIYLIDGNFLRAYYTKLS